MMGNVCLLQWYVQLVHRFPGPLDVSFLADLIVSTHFGRITKVSVDVGSYSPVDVDGVLKVHKHHV